MKLLARAYNGSMTTIDDISRAAAALTAGGAVVFPTDTVYGLGVAVGPCQTPEELFRIKRRPSDKPVAWLVESPNDLLTYGKEVPAAALELARAHWPGALTLVVRASERVPRAFQSEEGTIGLRMPAGKTALELIRAAGVPLATTSANISGCPAPSCDCELDPALLADAAVVLRGEDCPGGQASTVVDCTGPLLRVLRQGSIRVTD